MEQFVVMSKKDLFEYGVNAGKTALKIFQEEQKTASEPDPYMDAKQLEEVLPSMTASTIKRQIRDGKYGKKIGAKGKLVAKASEVKKFNRL